MRIINLLVICLLLLLAACKQRQDYMMVQGMAPGDSAKNDALRIVQVTLDEALVILRATKDPKEHLDRFKRRIFPNISFLSIAIRGIGADKWRTIGESEKIKIVKGLSILAGNFIMGKIALISNYDNAVISYENPQSIPNGRVGVKAIVNVYSVEKPIFFTLSFLGGKWKIADISAEGVSVAQNYIAQFSGIMNRENAVQQLLMVLDQKVRDIENN